MSIISHSYVSAFWLQSYDTEQSWWNIQYILQINYLAPKRFVWKFRSEIFMFVLVIDGWGITHEIALR